MKSFWIGLSVVMLGSLAVGACSGGSKPPPGGPCLKNSDCTSPLSCSYGTCHVTCTEARDCDPGQDCVKGPKGNVCQQTVEKTCQYKSQCMSPLECALDRQCRSQCLADVDCPTSTQKCVAPDMVCAEPADIDPVTKMLKRAGSTPVPDSAPDAGVDGDAGDDVAPDVAGTAGGSGGKGGGGAAGAAGGTGGASGTGGTGGIVVPCTSPQTTFGEIAETDPNAMFTSGVGVRTADQMLVFSAYSGPMPADFDGGTSEADAGAAVSMGNFIYVQAFNLTTGIKKGAATPILQASAGTSFGVFDVSIAPSGEIVILYGSQERGSGSVDTLYATFFLPTMAGMPLKVRRTVKLESTRVGNVHAAWAVPSHSFVLSWKYLGASWFLAVKKYGTDGALLGGATAMVPTPSMNQSNPSYEEGQVATSGELFGVASRDIGTGHAWLTKLNADGNQVGDLIELTSYNVEGAPWIALGGTANGFVSFMHASTTTYEVFIPNPTKDGGVAPDAGSDGGADAESGPKPVAAFSVPSTAVFGKAINDDVDGNGGVGLVQLEANGATFIYVKADGTTRLNIGPVISSSSGIEVAISNYHGSFAVSLFSGTTHTTQVVVSGCP